MTSDSLRKKKLLSDARLACEIDFELNDEAKLAELTLGSSRVIGWICPLGHRYLATPQARSNRNAGCPFCSGKRVLPGFNDLASQLPAIAASWSISKNYPVQPETVHMGSNKKFWWTCPFGHEWSAAVHKRAIGQNCSVCANKSVQEGVNDLASTQPSVANFWSPSNPRPASDFSAGSHESVLWLCSNNHEFRSSIREQAKGFSCPYCNGTKVLPGSSDFFSKFSELRKDWDEDANGCEAPNNLPISSRKYWWKCTFGHGYEASTGHRSRGQGCPYCSNKQIIAGFNDLETTHPILFGELSSEEMVPNRSLVSAGSDRKLQWVCPKCRAHYIASVASRVRGSACPVCANLKVIEGINDFSTTHPDLAMMWDFEKNLTKKPTEIVKGSNKKFFWRCDLGHSFQMSPNGLSENICPVCSNRVVEVGLNDLATLFPRFAAEWSSANTFSPSEVVPGSPKQAFWNCGQGHSFRQRINAHVRGQGCPYCTNTRVLRGFNDLATTHPALLDEWDWERNKRSPHEVMAGTNAKLWWKCVAGHSWAASGNKRVNERGCPSCAAGGFDSTMPATLYWLSHPRLRAMKVGITGQDKLRLNNLMNEGWQLVFRWDSSQGIRVRFVETHFFRWIRRDLLLPQYLGQGDMGRLGGASETFSSEVSEAAIREKLEELISVAEALTHDQLIDVKITRPRLR
jgi:hypothetical protein